MLIKSQERKRLPRFKGWGVLSAIVKVLLVLVALLAWKNAHEATKRAQDALKQGEEASMIAEEALNQSNQFMAINAEVQLNQLMDWYREVDEQIKAWEQHSAQIERERDHFVPTKSREELVSQLQQLNVPQNIKHLYVLRFERYESLLGAWKQYEAIKDRLSQLHIDLPAPPRLPRSISTGNDSPENGRF